MADRLRVSTEWLSWCEERLLAIARALEEAIALLARVDTDRSAGGDLGVEVSVGEWSGNDVRSALEAVIAALRATLEALEELIRAVRTAIALMEDAEERASAHAQDNGPGGSGGGGGGGRSGGGSGGGRGGGRGSLWSDIPWVDVIVPPSHPPRGPFDPGGSYGGAQCDIRTDYEDFDRIKALVERNTGHSFEGDEWEIYLERMSSEGCGYIAICNSIFAAYEGDPEGFGAAFGFSMFDGDELNYTELFADIYSRWDNRDAQGRFDALSDYDASDDRWDGYDYWHDRTGNGTSIEWRAEIAVKYLAEHGVQATTEVHAEATLTADMYNDMVSRGQVRQGQLQIRLSGEPAWLRNAAGEVAASYSGGHAMTVTGTTGSGPDAMLVVSSWGRTYYVAPGELCAVKGGQSTGSMGYMILNIAA